MFFTDDPISDFNRWDAEQQAKLYKLPICSECNEPIQEEYCYEINGGYICECCMNEHRKWVDDIVS